MNNYKVYCLTNEITGMKYIGVTKQKMCKRLKAGKGYKPTTKINLAIQEYGWENFNYEILYETGDKELAGLLERDYIKKYDTINNGYNMQSGGFKNYIGVKMTEQQKKINKERQMGKHYSPNTEFKKGVITPYNLSKRVKVYCVELDKTFDSISQAEQELNLYHVWDCANGRRNKCGGYHWELVKDGDE